MNTPRRIVLVGPMYPYRGGIAHLTERLAQGLVERDFHVYGITFTRQYPNFLFPGRTQYETDLDYQGVLKSERLIDSINPNTWWRTSQRIQQINPDLVIFRYWQPFFAPSFGTIARRLKGEKIRRIVLVDNILPHERRIGDVSLGRYFFKAMQGSIVMSKSVGEDLDRLNVSCPKSLSPHPIYDSFGRPGDPIKARKNLKIDSDTQVILFFGFIRKYKGLEVLIECLKKIHKRLPNFYLLVVGEFYEDEDWYQAKINDLGLSNYVRIIDQYIPQDQVPDYFAAADVVVQPYMSATQSGIAQMAFHFEVPVITTDVGGLAEIIPHEKAGLIIPPNDSDALANAIIRYFSDDMQEKLEQGVKQHKLHYGWDNLLDTVESYM